jgi:hypothetical protein
MDGADAQTMAAVRSVRTCLLHFPDNRTRPDFDHLEEAARIGGCDKNPGQGGTED